MRATSRIYLPLMWLTSASAAAQNAPVDRPLTLTVSESYRVGGSEAPEWATLVDVRTVAFGPQGELWLVDTRGGQLLRIEPDGKSGRSMARKGAGPGEVQAPLLLAVTSDGRALVGDLLNANLQLLAQDGKLLAYSAHSEITPLGAVRWLSGDQFVGVPRVYRIDGEARLSTARSDGEAVTGIPLVRFTVETTPQTSHIFTMAYHAAPRHAESLTPHAFLPANHWHTHGGRIAVADGPQYEIRLLDDAGRETGRITRAFSPRSPSRADIAAARAEARARLITPDGRPRIGGASASGAPGRTNTQSMLERVERALKDMTHAERVPLVQGLRFDDEGRLWIARTPDVWGKPPLLDVFSPSGEYLGTTQALARLPDAFGPGGRAAFIEKDELDVPYIVVRRYRIR